MKILYLHGLGSSANSMTVDILKHQFKGMHDIIAFDLYHECAICKKRISQRDLNSWGANE